MMYKLMLQPEFRQELRPGWLQGEVTSYGLLGALQQLATSKRIEVDTSLAPLAVPLV